MGRKILQGLAHDMCQIFLGYQVWDDLSRLERLGGGTLTIELISGHCTKDEEHIEPFAIIEKLRAWLSTQLSSHGLERSDIEEAVLAVDYTVRENAGHWWKRDRHRTWNFHFHCRSTIRGFSRDYSSVADGYYQFA